MPICDSCLKEVEKTKRFMLPTYVHNRVYDKDHGTQEHLDYYYYAKATYICDSCSEIIMHYISKAKWFARNPQKANDSDSCNSSCPFCLIDETGDK